jgi:hypothetical protein
MNIKPIEELINKVFQGIDIEEDQKKAIVGIFVFKFYEMVVDELLSCDMSNIKHIAKITQTIDCLVQDLDVKKKEVVLQNIKTRKIEILVEMIDKLTTNLDNETQKTIDKNLELINK